MMTSRQLLKEFSDVINAAARAQHDPSEGNLEALRFELYESFDAAETVADGASMQLAGAR